MKRRSSILALCLCLGMPDLVRPAPPPSPGAAAPPSGSLPSVAEKTAGLQKHGGFVPYYWDAGKGALLLEVVPGGGELLYGTSFATGVGTIDPDLDRGMIGPLGLCRFERSGTRVLFEQLQTENRGTSANPDQDRDVRDSFATSVLASLPVVAEDRGRVLVDATSFLMRDTIVAQALAQAGKGRWKQDIDRSAPAADQSGAFPRNTEIEALVTLTSEDPPSDVAAVLPDGRSLSVRIHHTFLALPAAGFAVRPEDPRIGFFPLFFRDHTAPFNAPVERYLATRWRLDAAHRTITYYLDRGIPEPERSAMRQAALWWNHAFAAAGFPNALVLKDLPEGASFLDARYSGIEWVHRVDRSWSWGQIQVDPRTGEILHAVANIDAYRRRTTDRIWRNLRVPDRQAGCDAADSPDLSWVAGEATPGERRLVVERLQYLVAHEVGHTLGLEHNWAATTFGWGSVMDYLAPNIQLRDGRLDLGDAYPHDIGSYDRLAIRWGYTAGDGPEALEAIVREGYARGIFLPLESDPRWAEYDWGPDPVGWLRTTMAVRRVILERFGTGQLRPGEPVADLQTRFSLAYLYHRFAIQAAEQFVGGQYQANAVAGDDQPPTAWVSAAKQKEAFDLLLEALEPARLDIPESILKVLVAAPTDRASTRERFPSDAGATFSRLTAARSLAALIVRPLLDPQRDARLALGRPDGARTLDGLLAALVARTWDEPAPRDGRLKPLARVAQREVLDGLLDLASSPSLAPEVRGAATSQLIQLRRKIHARYSHDPEEEAHLRLAEHDLVDFFDHPEARRPRPPSAAAPPGRPIG